MSTHDKDNLNRNGAPQDQNRILMTVAMKCRFLMKFILDSPFFVLGLIKYMFSRIKHHITSLPSLLTSSKNDNEEGEERDETTILEKKLQLEVIRLQAELDQREKETMRIQKEVQLMLDEFEVSYDRKELWRDHILKQWFRNFEAFVSQPWIHHKILGNDEEENDNEEINNRNKNECIDIKIVNSETAEYNDNKASKEMNVCQEESIQNLSSSTSQCHTQCSDDPLNEMLNGSLDMILGNRNFNDIHNPSLSSFFSSNKNEGHGRVWKNAELPTNWLEEEDERRRKPGDAVYEGPTGGYTGRGPTSRYGD